MFAERSPYRMLPAVLVAGVLVLGAGSLPFAMVRAEGAGAPPATTTATDGVEINASVQALSDVLRMGDLMEVMREEGVDYGKTLEAEMFDGRGGAQWQAVVGLIYDPVRLRSEFDAVLQVELGEDAETLAQAQAFFASDVGVRALTLELEARRALLDDAVEEAAKVQAEDMAAKNDPRLTAIKVFAETNDLIESNVSGALNANLAFFKGLADGGAMEDRPSESDMLSDVVSQEPQIRQDTEDWLYPYLALAYQPLSDADLAAYQAFSETPAGKKVNAALFVAFDKIFTRVSYDLGLAAAKQMQGEDI